MIRLLDVFSGIGGFSLAARWTGAVETVGFCEIDPFCQRVLAKHWPEVPIHDDIKTLTGDALARFGRIDFVTGGFPCQPFSIAGRGGGKSDDRYLWPAMAAVIAQARPTYVLAENSDRIRTMALDDICDDLESLGYAVRAVDVPAGALGAPHRRHRMWTLAYRDRGRELQPSVSGETQRLWSEDGAGGGIADIAGHGCDQWWPRGSVWDGEPEDTWRVDSADADAWGRRHGASIEPVCAGRDPAIPRLGRPAGPGVVGALHGVPNRVDRVRGLGNAIVPQVAYELMRVMFADEMQEVA